MISFNYNQDNLIIANNVLRQFKPEEIADCFVLPHGLSKSEKAEADAELARMLDEKRDRLLMIKF